MNPNYIWLVTVDRETGEIEASTLADWIRKDQDLWARKGSERPRLDWLILSAHDSREEAETRIEQLK